MNDQQAQQPQQPQLQQTQLQQTQQQAQQQTQQQIQQPLDTNQFNQQFLMLFTQFINNQGNLNQQLTAAQAAGPSLNINLPSFHGKAGENVST